MFSNTIMSARVTKIMNNALCLSSESKNEDIPFCPKPASSSSENKNQEQESTQDVKPPATKNIEADLASSNIFSNGKCTLRSKENFKGGVFQPNKETVFEDNEVEAEESIHNKNTVLEEDSDDSVKDENYEPDSRDISSDTEQSNLEEKSNSDEPNEEGSLANLDRSAKGRPRRGRKRKYAEQDRKTRKICTNSNKEYYSAKGKLVRSKEFVSCVCTCAMKCHEKLSVEEQRNFFNQYWNLADYNVQTAFISTCVRQESVKRKTVSAANSHKRQFSRQFFIQQTNVCRDMFVKTLQVSTKRINTALVKSRTLTILDRRGVSGGHNKMSVDQKNGVMTHINKFPRYKSHYCRTKRAEQDFLQESTTLPIMYKLYKLENENFVSFSSYKKIFLTEFNPKVKKPKKDTCNKCDTYKVKIENLAEEQEKIKFIAEHNMHLQEAELARKSMNDDLKSAAEDEKTEAITFDMQKTLPLPRLTTNIIFYKRQLWLYNCGLYAGSQKKSTFHLWIEGEAGRGAQEVGSCLKKYIQSNIPETVENLILWSDSCGGQNRNIKMVLLLKCILEESVHLKSIVLKFSTSGHSFLPNDSDFGDVECAIKKQNKIYSPQDYIKIMETCRKKRPIHVTKMENEDFVSTRKLEKEIVNRKKSCDSEKINWLHIKAIKVTKQKSHSIFVKSSHNNTEAYKEIDIKKGKGRQPTNKFSNLLEPLWPNGKPVAELKLKDIKSYMHLIPVADHPFYTNLIGDETIDEDVDGYNGGIDFEPEEIS